jgi:uncharacterized protein (TIGR02145 family)
MNLIKSLLIGTIAAAVCMAQTITISGIVKGTGGAPLSGASVSLEKAGLTATTNASGNFMLTSVGVRGQNDQLLQQKPSATIHNGVLWVNVKEKSDVEITIFTLQGQTVSRVQKIMEAGNYSMVLPNKGAGIYLYKVKTDGNEFLIKNYSFGSVSGRTAPCVQGPSSGGLAKLEKTAAVINDVIAVTAAGYLDYRVIVTNSDTTGIQILMLPNAGNVTDADGNVYQSVQIGNQVWAVSNLRTTKYNDNTSIPHVTDSAAWVALTAPAFCYYNNTTDANSIKKYGALYDWYAVNTGKLAPAGWHVPDTTEWNTLQNYLIANGYNWDGTTTGNKIAKSLAAKADWFKSATAGEVGNNLRANNQTGLSVLPAGYREQTGRFLELGGVSGGVCCMWSATAAVMRFLGVNDILLNRTNGPAPMNCGFSVRLVKDNSTGFTLTGAVHPDCAGSLTLSPNQTSYTQGQTVTVTFTPGNFGFSLDSWSGDASGSANPITVTMNANKSITANATHGGPVLSGPTTSTGAITLSWTFTWPGLASTNDHLDIEESTASASSGFTVIYQPLRGITSQAVTRTAGTYYYRIRAFMEPCAYFTPYSSVVTVTVSGSSGGTVTLTPTADAMVWKSSQDNSYADQNHSNSYLNVGNTWDVVFDAGTGKNIGVYMLQESAVEFALPPEVMGKTIVSAELKLYTYDVPLDAYKDVYTVAAYTGSWSETGITYNHEPNMYTSYQSTANGPATNANYTSFNVTSIVQMWANLTNGWVNNGFHIWDGNYSTSLLGTVSDRAAIYHCRESGGTYLKPQLIITYQ